MSSLGRFATRVCAAAAMVTLAAMPASGQSTSLDAPLARGHAHATGHAAAELDARVARLLGATKEASAAFLDRGAAIAAGYRRIGPDVPSMGEHWISPRLVVADFFDVTRPALLTYIEVDGRPVLTGVVYAAALAIGESPPTIFGGDAVWHEHNGTLDEEALLPDHHTAPSAAKGTRLAILHAWLWSPNPAGVFGTDNWTIPFLRLGLSPPNKFPEGAARALSLLSGADEYYLNLAGPAAAGIVAPLLVDCARSAAKVVEHARTAGGVFSDVDIEQLRHAWANAMSAVASTAGTEVARRMDGGRSP